MQGAPRDTTVDPGPVVQLREPVSEVTESLAASGACVGVQYLPWLQKRTAGPNEGCLARSQLFNEVDIQWVCSVGEGHRRGLPCAAVFQRSTL